jgi:hypothetical protein
MERAMEATDVQEDWPEVKIPRPRPDGSYSVESLGRWVDRLMGDDKITAKAAELLEPFLMRDEDSEPDPEPVDIPEPRPGGSEDVTRGESDPESRD